jgi:hypothetical protein
MLMAADPRMKAADLTDLAQLCGEPLAAGGEVVFHAPLCTSLAIIYTKQAGGRAK